jgi:hypothetical protein
MKNDKSQDKSIEQLTEETVEAIIIAPVAITVGAVRGVGSALKKLTDWI